MAVELSAARKQFPALSRPEVFLDNPGGTQMVGASLERMQRLLVEANANHGGLFATSQRMDETVHEARQAMADFFNASQPEEIIFGANMTTLTYTLSRALARSFQPGDTIVVTRMDHDGNIAPWLQAAEDRGLRVRWVDFDTDSGQLNLDDLQEALAEKPRLLAVGYASNALGTINPIGQITKQAHAAGTLVYVDAVQYAPHAPIDVQALDCDFLVCSAYKFYGPHAGILYGRYDLLDALPAYKVRPAPETLPDKFETGTGNFEAIAGVLGVMEYFEWLGRTLGEEYHEQLAGQYSGRALVLKQAMTALQDYDLQLNLALLDQLQAVPGIQVYGISDPDKLSLRVPTFTFNLPGKTPAEVARALGQEQIYIWNGNFYALDISLRYGVEEMGGFARVGAVHYNSLEEIQRFGEALKRIASS